MIDQLTFQTISMVLTGLTLSVAAIYYMFTLRYTRMNMKNTLETRQAQLFMQMYGRWSEETFHDAATDIRSTSWVDFHDFKSMILEDPKKYKSLGTMIRFYEGIGVLVKEGLIDMRFVSLLMAGDIRQFWEEIGPIIGPWRKEWNYPRLVSETEYLSNSLIKYMDEHPELKT